MRRSSILATALVTAIALAAFAPPAMAVEHLMKVSEIQTGPNTFIELRESSPEPFPNNYEIAVYDARGQKLVTDGISETVLRQTGTEPYTLAAPPPSPDDGDEFTNIKLDPSAGQVCFSREGAPRPIHCLSYGCVTSPVDAEQGNDGAPAPTASRTPQRQGDGKYQLANPTPDAQNAAGRRAPTCIKNGNGGPNRIVGTPFDDLLIGAGGNDRIRGLGGNDRIRCGSGRDRVLAGGGNDRVAGGSGSDRLAGGAGNDRLLGNSGNDRLFGDGGRDRLNGGTGRDRLRGGFGNDILNGGPGFDLLRGGPGADTVVRR